MPHRETLTPALRDKIKSLARSPYEYRGARLEGKKIATFIAPTHARIGEHIDTSIEIVPEQREKVQREHPDFQMDFSKVQPTSYDLNESNTAEWRNDPEEILDKLESGLYVSRYITNTDVLRVTERDDYTTEHNLFETEVGEARQFSKEKLGFAALRTFLVAMPMTQWEEYVASIENDTERLEDEIARLDFIVNPPMMNLERIHVDATNSDPTTTARWILSKLTSGKVKSPYIPDGRFAEYMAKDMYNYIIYRSVHAGSRPVQSTKPL